MKKMYLRKRIVQVLMLLIIMCAATVLTACGAKIDEDNSPRLLDIELTSYSENTEDSQYVQADLIFDRDISLTSDKCENLRITIADDRVQEDEYVLMEGESSNIARLKISVNAITKGVLKIEKLKEDKPIKEICSEDGKYAVYDFSVEAIIPSGVTLSTVESASGKVVKSVNTYWNIRSIAWVGLTENGELIPVSETRQLEMLDGYAAVHGHEFLMEDQNDIAVSIVEVLKSNYGSDYSFAVNDDQITVTKAGSDAVLDINIYQYKKIDGKLLK